MYISPHFCSFLVPDRCMRCGEIGLIPDLALRVKVPEGWTGAVGYYEPDGSTGAAYGIIHYPKEWGTIDE